MTIKELDRTRPFIKTEEEFVKYVQSVVERDPTKNPSVIALGSFYVFCFDEYVAGTGRLIDRLIATATHARNVHIQKLKEIKTPIK